MILETYIIEKFKNVVGTFQPFLRHGIFLRLRLRVSLIYLKVSVHRLFLVLIKSLWLDRRGYGKEESGMMSKGTVVPGIHL